MPDITLRQLVQEDLSDWVTWFNDQEVTEFTLIEVGQVTPEGEQRWFEAVTAPDYRDRNWQIDVEGRHIGGCSLTLSADGRQAEFGIVIGEKNCWGRGYGTAAVRETLRRGFAELKLHRIFLHAFAGNARGVRCYEKCGFRHEGRHVEARRKRGEWKDMASMAILRGEWQQVNGTSEPPMNADDGNGRTAGTRQTEGGRAADWRGSCFARTARATQDTLAQMRGRREARRWA